MFSHLLCVCVMIGALHSAYNICLSNKMSLCIFDECILKVFGDSREHMTTFIFHIVSLSMQDPLKRRCSIIQHLSSVLTKLQTSPLGFFSAFSRFTWSRRDVRRLQYTVYAIESLLVQALRLYQGNAISKYADVLEYILTSGIEENPTPSLQLFHIPPEIYVESPRTRTVFTYHQCRKAHMLESLLDPDVTQNRLGKRKNFCFLQTI